jgi:hypothetical protein
MTDETSVDGLETNSGNTPLTPEPESSSASDNTNLAPSDDFISKSQAFAQQKAVREKYYEKGLRAAQAQNQQYDQPVSQPSGPSGGVSASQVNEMIGNQLTEITNRQREEAGRARLQEMANSAILDFQSKSDEVKKSNPDFDGGTLMKSAISIAPAAFTASSSLENSPDIWNYLISEKPLEIQNIENLMTPQANATVEQVEECQKIAFAQLRKISERLKQNKNAKNMPDAPNPIGQIETDVRDGVGGSEPESVTDWISYYDGKG